VTALRKEKTKRVGKSGYGLLENRQSAHLLILNKYKVSIDKNLKNPYVQGGNWKGARANQVALLRAEI